MVETVQSIRATAVHRLGPLWHGHVFVFDRPIRRPVYPNATGLHLLLLAGTLETFRIAINSFGATLSFRYWAPLFVLLSFPCLRMVGLSARQIGLRPWREWNTTERAYFAQTLILTNAVFPAVFTAQLSRAISLSPPSLVAVTFVAYLFLGFFQELLYRGMLQTEFTRRWGPFTGILVSNLVYTFVQHYDYFRLPTSSAVQMFAAVFAIGVLFAIVYWRSGNLWIVGVMHAFGNAYIVTAFGRIS
jgi:membrane protease YdiL (CAAX protease family)